VASVASALRDGDEFIVAADGEGDGSWRIAERHGAQVVKLPSAGGPACARNAGAAAATSDILLFVDADVTIPPDCVMKVAAIFRDEPELAAVIGSYDAAPAQADFLSQFKNLFHHYVHQHGSGDASTFWGACGAIRREIFLRAGGFDETYARPSVEDIELGYRLRAASHRIRLAHDLQVKHWKKWDARNLVKTDMLDRAAPWTELILRQAIRRKAPVGKDLNLGTAYRFSVITSYLLVACLMVGLIAPWVLWMVPPLLGVFLSLHHPLFRFFKEKRGWRFLMRTVFWRFCYDLCSGIGFLYGACRFARRAFFPLPSEVSPSFSRGGEPAQIEAVDVLRP
jgi:glycosyltransferase involved in cell wall biosynthesis